VKGERNEAADAYLIVDDKAERAAEVFAAVDSASA
jgi:hypothetical protein